MTQLFTNNAASRLASSITNVATSLSLVSGGGADFPTLSGGDTFKATILKADGSALEIVLVTARTGDAFGTIVRAQEGTTAVAFAAGDSVELRITDDWLNDVSELLDDPTTQTAVDTKISKSLVTTLGDLIYATASAVLARLAGNTTTTKKYLSQTGNGAVSAAPAWAQIDYADITGTLPGGAPTGSASGDLTGSYPGPTIAADAVTYAKIQNVSATDKLLGRSTAGAGDVEEIACTAAARSVLDDTTTVAMLTTLGAVPLATLTTKGDLYVATASATAARQGVGTNGYRLEADSAQTNGIKWAAEPEVLVIAVSDETTAIATGTAKITFRMPFAMTVTAVRADLNTASSSGNPTVDINEAGTTILSTKITIDSGELTSATAATAAVISDASLADNAEMTIDIDTAGTGAKGLKVTIIGTRT